MYNQNWGDLADTITIEQGSAHKLAARNLIATAFPNHHLQFSEHGKPQLHPFSAEINHSHAGHFALFIYHPSKSVGVDVEQLRPQLLKIYPKFCNQAELIWLSQEPQLLPLLLIWCAKEALYKAIGKKGTDFRDHLSISNILTIGGEIPTEGRIQAQIHMPDLNQNCELHYQIWNNEYAAVWIAL